MSGRRYDQGFDLREFDVPKGPLERACNALAHPRYL
jgi:hypothetical protein